MLPKAKRERGRPAALKERLEALKGRGVFRAADAKRLGISQPSLSRFVSEKRLECVAPRLYLHPESALQGEEREFAVACARFGGESVIGGLTALFYYQLIEQVPHRVWVLVPYSRTSPEKLYRCIRTKTDPKEGVENRRHFRITNIERTLVEAFKFSGKIGLRLAFRATREAIHQKRTTLPKIYRQAEKLGMRKMMEKYWEALVPESGATP